MLRHARFYHNFDSSPRGQIKYVYNRLSNLNTTATDHHGILGAINLIDIDRSGGEDTTFFCSRSLTVFTHSNFTIL